MAQYNFLMLDDIFYTFPHMERIIEVLREQMSVLTTKFSLISYVHLQSTCKLVRYHSLSKQKKSHILHWDIFLIKNSKQIPLIIVDKSLHFDRFTLHVRLFL